MSKRGWSHESPANKSIEWFTPPNIFEALGLEFDLDPCSPGEGKDFVPAKKRFTIEDDGLSQPWEGTVFCNPPYGRETAKWMQRMAWHNNGIALVFARTDPAWFQDLAHTMDTVLFIRGRVRFYAGNTTSQGSTPGAGSMLIAWGERASKALLHSGLGVAMKVVGRERPGTEGGDARR